MTKRLFLPPFPMHHNVVRFYDYIPRILTYAATWAAERKQWKVVWKSWILIQQRRVAEVFSGHSYPLCGGFPCLFSPLSPPNLLYLLRYVPMLNWIPVLERGRGRAWMSCNNIFSITEEISQLCVKSRNSCAVMPYSKDPGFLCLWPNLRNEYGRIRDEMKYSQSRT